MGRVSSTLSIILKHKFEKLNQVINALSQTYALINAMQALK
jgi:hypothetical protein